MSEGVILALTLFGIFLGLLVWGLPIGFALGLSGIVGLIFIDKPFIIFAQNLIAGIENFSYLAIPFFVLLGVVMEKAEISRSLVDFANEFVGSIRGGIAIVSVVASAIFAAISGSGPATVAAIGSITYPDMVKQGYSKRFSVGVVSAAGTLGPIIPPSISFIIYGVCTGESITKLFMGGMGAGLFLALLLAIFSYVKARLEKVPISGKRPSMKGVARAIWQAKGPLIAPIVVLGTIYAGICTPTEAGAIGSIYVIAIGVYKRTLTFRSFCECVISASKISAMIMFVLFTAYLLAWVISAAQVPQIITNSILSWCNTKFTFFIFVIFIFMIIGSLLDTPAAIVILAPILAPIAVKLGIDPIHFGVVLVLDFTIGYITPPIAVNLFVATGITKLSMEECVMGALPFFFILTLGLILIALVPDITLFFPKFLYG
jgi:C4-dicarboxylate transporter DctM subunit